ncbi:MAG: GNAT family N-acetyltransferase [Bacteroidetes bacterium]|nr:GNAT family N-acetyltransferase [Bacteroidota bacterium]
MEKGYTVLRELPPEFKEAYDVFLFHQSAHLKLQHPEWMHFYLVSTPNRKALAHLAFQISDKLARSPFKAPFGVMSCSGGLGSALLYQFIKDCETELRVAGVTRITITEPPQCLRSEEGLIQTMFLNLGYHVSKAELSACIPVDQTLFEEKLDDWEIRKLQQSRKQGLNFRELSFASLKQTYEFILSCRKQKGHTLSLSWDELSRTARTFSDSFEVAGTFLGDEWAAASISIRIHEKVTYNFYSAHDVKFDSISPVVMLMEGLYTRAQKQEAKWLDLGTSMTGSLPNFDLLDFKRRLGGVPSMKLTFEKELS